MHKTLAAFFCLIILFAISSVPINYCLTKPDPTLTITKKDRDKALLLNSLTEAKTTDFFKFFSLTEVNRSKDKDSTIVSFKPAGGDFRKLVTVEVAIDNNEIIDAMNLILSREFIDDPTNGIFARDIAKSLLLASISQAEIKPLDEFINQLQNRSKDSSNSAKTTPAYLTYLGKQTSFQQSLPSSQSNLALTLKLENINSDGKPALAILVKAEHAPAAIK